jgi:hypothetical protein
MPAEKNVLIIALKIAVTRAADVAWRQRHERAMEAPWRPGLTQRTPA